MTTKPHEARSLPLGERIDYLMTVASMAGADVVLDPAEMDRLKGLCSELGLPDEETKKILMAAHRPTASVERHLEGLKESPLRFTLLSDCLTLAYADGIYEKHERHEIHELARALGVDDEQLTAIEGFVKAAHDAASDKAGDHQSTGKAIAEKLAAVGVPIGAVAAVSAIGLEMAGVTSGLAAFGMGLGIATGFGAVLGLGIGSYMGVKWLRERVTK